MWNLGEYRKHPQRLADHLPWATLIAPGVMLNKDGSLQKTIAFRGPDLDSSTPYELVAARARMNNVLRRLGSHWCVHVEASRRLAHVYPASDFPNPVAAMIDQERRDSFTADALHFESQCFITFTYLPPAEGMTRLGDFFIDRPNNKVEGRVSYRAHFDHFLGQVDQIVNLMASFMPEVHPLDDGETLTYLHSCISDRQLTVAVPDVPFYLDEMITDRPLAGGLTPRLGRLFLKTVSIRAYVNRTLPCLLDRLNELPIEYRWIGRYLPMDKTDATRQLNKLRRQWFAKRKGMVTLLKEAITKQESKLEDSDSLNKSEDVDAALQELGGDHCSFGDFTLTITVWDEDEQTATEKARAVQQVVDGVGLVTEIEDFNAVQAWMGSLPGHAYADVRRPLVSSLNVCDLVPLSAVWSGPARCAHLDGPPLLVTRTKGSTPFRMSLHQGDVGHTIIAGPTGAGKSTLLNLIACQWLRYPDARVYIFDIIVQFARKIVYIGLFAWIIQNWQKLTDTLARSFMDLGLKAGGFDGATYYTQQPGNIAYLGYTTAQPLMDQISRLTGPVAFFKNFVEIAFLFLAICAIVAAFCIITIQVVVALLTFKFGSLAAFVLVPFAVLSKTAFIAERPLGWVVGSGVRLMVLTLVLGVGNNIFQELKVPPGQTVTTYQAFCIALAALLLMVLSLVASRLASDLIIGGPSLGVGTAINTSAMALNTTAATADKTRSAVKAVKMAATVPAKGVMLAASAGTAVLRKITGSGNSVGNKTGTTVASAVPGTTATQAGGSPTASNTASRVPGSNTPGSNTPGKSGPTNTGGTPT